MRLYRVIILLALLGAGPAAARESVPDSLLARSQALERAGQYDNAVRLAQSAIVADPARASSYAALGEIYMHAGKTEFARFYFLKALDIDPQDARSRSDLALADRADQTDLAGNKKP